MLGFPSGTIPASGAVTVTVDEMELNAGMSFAGVVAGVAGTLSSDGTVFTFTRASAGDEVGLAGTAEFTPDLGTQHAARTTILNIGKNDLPYALTAGRPTAQVVNERTDQAFDYLAPLRKRVLVLNHFQNTNTAAESAQRVRIQEVNAAIAARYGRLALDMAGYLASSQVWADTGITPTSEDLAQQALGNKPPSLSGDNLHMNTAGYTAVRDHLIAPRIAELGWYA
jgi:lysophospholipase L1-like esterase